MLAFVLINNGVFNTFDQWTNEQVFKNLQCFEVCQPKIMTKLCEALLYSDVLLRW